MLTSYYSRATPLQGTVETDKPTTQATVEADRPATQAMVEIRVTPTVLPTPELVPQAMVMTLPTQRPALRGTEPLEGTMVPTDPPPRSLHTAAMMIRMVLQHRKDHRAMVETMIHTDLPTPGPQVMAGTPLGLQDMVEVMTIHTAPLATKRATPQAAS